MTLILPKTLNDFETRLGNLLIVQKIVCQYVIVPIGRKQLWFFIGAVASDAITVVVVIIIIAAVVIAIVVVTVVVVVAAVVIAIVIVDFTSTQKVN